MCYIVVLEAIVHLFLTPEVARHSLQVNAVLKTNDSTPDIQLYYGRSKAQLCSDANLFPTYSAAKTASL